MVPGGRAGGMVVGAMLSPRPRVTPEFLFRSIAAG